MIVHPTIPPFIPWFSLRLANLHRLHSDLLSFALSTLLKPVSQTPDRVLAEALISIINRNRYHHSILIVVTQYYSVSAAASGPGEPEVSHASSFPAISLYQLPAEMSKAAVAAAVAAAQAAAKAEEATKRDMDALKQRALAEVAAARAEAAAAKQRMEAANKSEMAARAGETLARNAERLARRNEEAVKAEAAQWRTLALEEGHRGVHWWTVASKTQKELDTLTSAAAADPWQHSRWTSAAGSSQQAGTWNGRFKETVGWQTGFGMDETSKDLERPTWKTSAESWQESTWSSAPASWENATWKEWSSPSGCLQEAQEMPEASAEKEPAETKVKKTRGQRSGTKRRKHTH